MRARLTPETARKNIAAARASMLACLLATIIENVARLDKSNENTLAVFVGALLSLNVEQKELADVLGVSRPSIARWASGKNIPRSPGFRSWAVERLLEYARERGPESSLSHPAGGVGELTGREVGKLNQPEAGAVQPQDAATLLAASQSPLSHSQQRRRRGKASELAPI
jgi:transcriptional regulator with XRE-family HTH domain